MSKNQKAGPLEVVRSLLAPILGLGEKPAESAGGPINQFDAGVTALSELFAERRRITALLLGEDDRVEALDAKIAELEERRVSLLAEVRISGDAAGQASADSVRVELESVRRERADSDAIGRKIRERVAAIDHEIERAKIGYLRDLGAFLDGMYGELIAQYNEKAPELAEIFVNLAAIRRVMMQYHAGNSNGWDGTALLPGMKHLDGRTIAPIVDAGSRQFDTLANARMAQVLDQLRGAGFAWRFD